MFVYTCSSSLILPLLFSKSPPPRIYFFSLSFCVKFDDANLYRSFSSEEQTRKRRRESAELCGFVTQKGTPCKNTVPCRVKAHSKKPRIEQDEGGNADGQAGGKGDDQDGGGMPTLLNL